MKRSAFLCSVVIFIQYREVSIYAILLNFIGHCRDSIVFAFWWRRRQKRERGAYVEEAHVRQVLSCFITTPLVNQNNSPGQPKESLRPFATITIYSWWQPSEVGSAYRIWNFGALAKGGGEAGRAHSCMCTTSFHPPLSECSKILNSVRASDLAWLPPAAHSNCSEAVCLAARTWSCSWSASSAESRSLLNIVRFPPVWYYQILSAIGETVLAEV